MGTPTRSEKSIANEFLSFTRAPLTALTTYLINFSSPNQTLPTTSHNTPLHGSSTALWWCQAWLVTELKASTPGDKAQMLGPTPALVAAQKRAVSLGLLAGVVVGVLLADDGQVAADAGHHLVATQLGTLQRGVLATDHGQVAVGVHHGFNMRGAVAAALALGGAGRHVPTGLRADAEADLTAAALVLRRLRVVFRFAAQGDVVPRGQRHVVTLHLAADGAAHRRLVVAGLAGTGTGGANADRTDSPSTESTSSAITPNFSLQRLPPWFSRIPHRVKGSWEF